MRQSRALSAGERLLHRLIASVRVVVEHVIASVSNAMSDCSEGVLRLTKEEGVVGCW